MRTVIRGFDVITDEVMIGGLSALNSLTFLPVVIANMFIGIFQELHAKKVLDNLSILHEPTAAVIRDGREEQIPVADLVLHWDADRPEVPGMYELVRELAENGYALYLLTNASIRHREYWPTFRFAPFFGDRIMLSAAWHLMKPEHEFYEKAIELLGFDPNESVFIDDQPVNVEGAEGCGIPGIVFHNDVALLRQRLREKGVRVSP